MAVYFDGVSTDELGIMPTDDYSIAPATSSPVWAEPTCGLAANVSRYATGDINFSSVVDGEYWVLFVDGDDEQRNKTWLWLLEHVHGQYVEMSCDWLLRPGADDEDVEPYTWMAECNVSDVSETPHGRWLVRVDWQRLPWLWLEDGSYAVSVTPTWEAVTTEDGETDYEDYTLDVELTRDTRFPACLRVETNYPLTISNGQVSFAVGVGETDTPVLMLDGTATYTLSVPYQALAIAPKLNVTLTWVRGDVFA